MPPTTVKGIRSFLGHAGFYRRFIRDFSKIARPLCRLLEKDAKFNFDESCQNSFEEIKSRLVEAPIMAKPDWNKEFEIMCDASNYEMGAVLGQKDDKVFRTIYYSSKTFNEAQENYSTTEKEMLAMVLACEKFRPYILGSHVIIHTDHAKIFFMNFTELGMFSSVSIKCILICNFLKISRNFANCFSNLPFFNL